jgi:hypothetical protein
MQAVGQPRFTGTACPMLVEASNNFTLRQRIRRNTIFFAVEPQYHFMRAGKSIIRMVIYAEPPGFPQPRPPAYSTSDGREADPAFR